MDENENVQAQIPELLMRFLDARSAKEKLEILDDLDMDERESIDDRMLNNMEASLDIVGKGDIDTRLDFIKYHLRMHSKYETSRLR